LEVTLSSSASSFRKLLRTRFRINGGAIWWGWSSYHDQWLSEGFADFSAGLFLQFTEKKLDKFNEFWERGRKAVIEKNQYGNSPNDAGPLWMGLRLNTFKTGTAYQKLVYAKGGYILHMLRQMMWDAQNQDRDFISLMHDFVKSNEQKNASTEDFLTVVNRHMKKSMDLAGNGNFYWFFHQWVYGTEIPRYRMEYSISAAGEGKVTLAGKVTQSDVSAGFRMPVPVYVEFEDGIVRLGSVVVAGNTTTPEIQDHPSSQAQARLAECES
jgi:aminopeptidase N